VNESSGSASAVRAIEGGTDRATTPLLTLTAACEIAISTYFAASFLQYVKFLPLSHLVNLAFLPVFAYMAMLRKGEIRLAFSDARALAYLSFLAAASLLCWVLRDSWDITELARSLTWLTPAALLLVVCGNEQLRHERIGFAVAAIGVGVNLGITLMFARFNTELAKFEIPIDWIGISSNELSFHLITFGFLFLLLSRGQLAAVARLAIAIGSLIHLSKAHLASAAVSPLLAFTRRRVWFVVLMAGVVVAISGWLATPGHLTDFEIPQQVQRVFGPMRDLLSVAAQAMSAGELRDITTVAEAVGLYRFEVYEQALSLLADSSVGLSSMQVDIALRGLDPHSNILYLGLREGWIVAGTYVLLTMVFVRRIPATGALHRWILAALIYAFLRSLFITFDPVKLMAVLVYFAAVTRPGPAISEAPTDDR
jgi:hypothetical protein